MYDKIVLSNVTMNKKKQKNCILTSGGETSAARHSNKKYIYRRFCNAERLLLGESEKIKYEMSGVWQIKWQPQSVFNVKLMYGERRGSNCINEIISFP